MQSFALLLLLACAAQFCHGANNTGTFCSAAAIPTGLLPIGSYFLGRTVQQICSIMGTILVPSTAPPAQPDSSPIAPSFDWRVTKSNCIGPIQDQGNCGCCYSFSATEVLAARTCIANTNTTSTVVFAAQDPLNCDRTCTNNDCDSGCNGGYLDSIWKYLSTTGVVTRNCLPYTGSAQTCTSACSATDTYVKYVAKDYFSLSSVSAIQRSIQSGGPVSAGMMVTQSFLSYSGGVFTVPSGDPNVGGHAVVLLGWGTDNGVNYWIGMNSWGTSWGESGYFRIRQGTNEAQIESYVVAGTAPNASVEPNTSSASALSQGRVASAMVFALAILILF